MIRYMTTIRTRAKVGAHGKVSVAVGAESAGAEVDVTIEPAHAHADSGRSPITREEWLQRIKDSAGSLPEFEVPEDLPANHAPLFE